MKHRIPQAVQLCLLCYLSGLKDPEHAFAGPMGGAIMETAVLTEIVKTYLSRGISPQIYFWRTRAGADHLDSRDNTDGHSGRKAGISVYSTGNTGLKRNELASE